MPVRSLDLVAVLRDAWLLFRRDRHLLIALSAPFHFLPAYALALLAVEPPLPGEGGGEAATIAWMAALEQWVAANGVWYALAYAAGFLGTAAVQALYLTYPAPDLRGALRIALGLWPRVLLAMLLVSLVSGAGLLLWVVPGLYAMGRLLVTGPVLIAERPVGAAAAMVRSVRLTRGQGLAAMGLAAAPVLGGFLLAQPFVLLDGALGGAGNPVLRAIVDAGAAAAAMAAGLAQALIAPVAYRRLAMRGI